MSTTSTVCGSKAPFRILLSPVALVVAMCEFANERESAKKRDQWNNVVFRNQILEIPLEKLRNQKVDVDRL